MEKNFLDSKILELKTYVDKHLHKFDQHLEGKIDKQGDINNIIQDYRNIYKLTLEINMLNILLKNLENESDKYNIDILKEVNSMVYANNFYYSKEINKLFKVLENRHYHKVCENHKIQFIKEKSKELSNNKLNINDFDILISESRVTVAHMVEEYIEHKLIKQSNQHYTFDHMKVNTLNENTLLFGKDDIQNLYEGMSIIKPGKEYDIVNLANGILKVKDEYNKKQLNNGLFLVKFNVLYKLVLDKKNKNIPTKKDNSIIYQYLNYNTMFSSCLVSYIEEYYKYQIKTFNSSPTIFVLDKDLCKYRRWDEKTSQDFFVSNYLNYRLNKSNILESMLLLSRSGPKYLDNDSIVELIILILNNDKKYLDKLGLLQEYTELEDILKRNHTREKVINLYEVFNPNILFNFVFLVRDLESLLSSLKGYNVNGGPQKWRDQVNSLNSSISTLDEGFRKSMYNHYDIFEKYYSRMSDKKLTYRRHFSFNNIHINLGNVKWYSTKSASSLWRKNSSKFNQVDRKYFYSSLYFRSSHSSLYDKEIKSSVKVLILKNKSSNSIGNNRLIDHSDLELLACVIIKEQFVSSLDSLMLSLGYEENNFYRLYYYLKTKQGCIDFFSEVESKYGWSYNLLGYEDYLDNMYSDEYNFYRYSLLAGGSYDFNKKLIEYIKVHVEDVHSKLSNFYRGPGFKNNIFNFYEELYDFYEYTVLIIRRIYRYNKPSLIKYNKKNNSNLSNINYGNKRSYSSLVNKDVGVNNNHVLFKEVKNILRENPFNDITQKRIEKLMVDNNILRFSKDNIDMYEVIGRLNKELKQELIMSSKQLGNLINNFKDRKLFDKYKSKKLTKKEIQLYYLSTILDQVSVEYVVSILIGQFLKIMNSSTQDDINTAKVFTDLGNYLINHYFYVLYKNNNNVIKDSNNNNYRYNLRDWKQDNKELVEKFDSIVSHAIGGLLVDWLRDSDLLELSVVKSIKQSNQQISVLIPTSKMKDLFILVKPLVLPNKIPMIVKPKSYKRVILDNANTREVLGGYLLNGDYYSNEIIIKNWRSKETSKIENVNSIYRTINNMSSVGYKINKNVLDFIRLNDSNLGLTMLNLSHDLEKKICNKSKLLKWEKIELEKFNSKKLVQENIIALADLFEDIHEFFIPVRMDYRGRIYCESDYLNYQGTDLAKSLLLFAKGEKILKSDLDSINFLKIFGANCYGLDKKSFNDRIKWVDENQDLIRNFNNGILINKAESKFMFISFCFEYNRWLDCIENSNSTHFITYLPIQLDASCNGYQHISMLVQDIDLAKHLNLNKSTKDDIPDDFYSIVGSYLDVYYNLKLNEKDLSKVDKDSINRLKSLYIKRSIIKKAIMTIPYNASSIQLIKYLQEPFEFDENETKFKNEKIDINTSYQFDRSSLFNTEDEDMENKIEKLEKIKKQIWYKHRNDNNIKLESRDFINLYRALIYIIDNIFPSLNHLSKYFKDIANICTKLNISIPWYLPSGLVAYQSYMKIKEIRVEPLNFSNNTFSLKIPIRNQFDKNKQMRALMPNLVHSLDSTSLVLLIDKYFYDHKSDFKNIYAIHDCFGVTCNNMWYIVNALKFIYINLYTDGDYLEKLNNDLIKHLKNHIGDAFSEKDLVIKLDNSKPIKYPDIKKVIKHTYNIQSLRESSYIIN